jgi:L-alanine-DL-glutamate epimerase-like enolase superfamily enzyme
LHDRLAGTMRPLANQWGAPGPFHQALAGADIALWDARARWLDKPLCDVIAQASMPRTVAVYATNLPIGEPAAIRDVMRGGHSRFKVRLPQDRQLAVEGLRAWRAAAGEHPLMADATQGYTLEHLRALLPDLVDARLTWLEEPFAVDDAAAYRAWNEVAGRPPTAMGENSYGIEGFDRLLADCRPDIVQPDITKTGGISRGRRICERMLAAGKPVCLHMYGGPVGLYASAHLMAAIPGTMWLEMEATPNAIFARLLRVPPVVEGGALRLSDAPGIGGAFDVDAIRAGDITD